MFIVRPKLCLDKYASIYIHMKNNMKKVAHRN